MQDIVRKTEDVIHSREYETGTIVFKKLNEFATIPSYGSSGAAGMDLHANFRAEGFGMINLEPGDRRLIKTGIAASIPLSTYARVAPRSGLAYKHGIDVMAGVIDEDYRGDIGVILINHGNEPVVIQHGDRIAQLIVTNYTACAAIESDTLPDTDRGSGGFGSTGK